MLHPGTGIIVGVNRGKLSRNVPKQGGSLQKKLSLHDFLILQTMGLIEDLQQRSGNQCELCGASGDLKVYEVPPVSTGGVDGSLLGCGTCIGQLEDPESI